jgi:hypothetical protein
VRFEKINHLKSLLKKSLSLKKVTLRLLRV